MEKLVGSGLLDWRRAERVTSRHGTISLFVPESEMRVMFLPDQSDAGKRGKLRVRLRDIRPTAYTKKVEMGLYQSMDITPIPLDLQTTYTLGEGVLFFETVNEPDDLESPGLAIGLNPSDGRETDWLADNMLLALQQQYIDVYFEEVADDSANH